MGRIGGGGGWEGALYWVYGFISKVTYLERAKQSLHCRQDWEHMIFRGVTPSLSSFLPFFPS